MLLHLLPILCPDCIFSASITFAVLSFLLSPCPLLPFSLLPLLCFFISIILRSVRYPPLFALSPHCHCKARLGWTRQSAGPSFARCRLFARHVSCRYISKWNGLDWTGQGVVCGAWPLDDLCASLLVLLCDAPAPAPALTFMVEILVECGEY
ncbi:hypothetical protein IWZ03DRAFT_13916 [Phyllosticta citriasiana]|uniref:Uncharacterized protein n=1 Tax=Phyllosticta citriasiana TaxID=595635 RepID=A0ABR1KYH8_9PEZI